MEFSRLSTIRNLLEMIRFSHTLFALPFALLSAALAWKQKEEFSWIELLGIVACMVFVLIWAFSSSTCLNRIVLLTVAYVGTVAYRLAKLMFAPRAG